MLRKLMLHVNIICLIVVLAMCGSSYGYGLYFNDATANADWAAGNWGLEWAGVWNANYGWEGGYGTLITNGSCVINSGDYTVSDFTMYSNHGDIIFDVLALPAYSDDVMLTVKNGASLHSNANFDLGYFGGAGEVIVNVEAGGTVEADGYFLGGRAGAHTINLAGTVQGGNIGMSTATLIDFDITGALTLVGDVRANFLDSSPWIQEGLITDRGVAWGEAGWGTTHGLIANHNVGTDLTTVTSVAEPENQGGFSGDIDGDGIVGLSDLAIFTNQYLEDPNESVTRIPWIDARDFNSGILNDRTINQALFTIGSSVKTLLLEAGTWQISDSVAVPLNVNLKFEEGAILDISSTKTVTINGPIEAPISQIFSGDGAVSFGLRVKEAYPQWWGTVGTADDTAVCQAALDCGVRTIRFSPDIYNIDADGVGEEFAGLQVPSDVVLIFEPGSKLKAIANSSENSSVLTINGKDNIRIEGITIEGDRATHTGSSGEWGHGIVVTGTSSRIVIKDSIVYDCWGDGIYIGYGNIDGVYVDNSEFDHNRRNACSITKGKNILFTNCTFSDTDGTSPYAGVDVEPNYGSDYIQNIVFRDCISYGNMGNGFGVQYDGALNDPVSVMFGGCTSDGNGTGFAVTLIRDTQGKVTIEDCSSSNARERGFACAMSNLRTEINGLNIYNPNQLSRSTADWGSGFAVYNASSFTDKFAGNITARDVYIESTDSKALYALYLSNLAGGNSGIENIDIELTTNMANDKRFSKEGGPYVGYCKVGFPDNPVYATTSSMSSGAMPIYIGQKITNEGATGDISLSFNSSLAASFGSEYIIEVVSAHRITLDFSSYLLLPGAASSLWSNEVGSRIKIRSNGSNWYIEEMIGNWQ